MKKRTGFTLIELLIVVAIIAILAAIAVPNFLEAQVRSKVSRCRADMRTQVTAVETYYIDHNSYPPSEDYSPTSGNPLNLVWNTGDPAFHARMGSVLTTPIAYMTSLVYDPFVTSATTYTSPRYPRETRVGERYAWFPWRDYYLNPTAGGKNPAGFADFWNGPINWTGAWLMYGYGPDQQAFHGPAATFLPYDATNGTVSLGNVVRTQKIPDGIPPHPITKTFNWN